MNTIALVLSLVLIPLFIWGLYRLTKKIEQDAAKKVRERKENPPSDWSVVYNHLTDQRWYRFLKIISIMLLMVAFLLPFFQGQSLETAGVDGLVNALVWSVIIFVGRRALIYTLYGSDPAETIKNMKKS